MKTEQIQLAVKEFARTNKVSVAKVDAFAKQLIVAVKPTGMGRKPEQSTVVFRKKLKDAVAAGKIPQQFTVNQVIAVIGGSQADVNNALRFFKEKESLFSVVGKQPKQKGERGRSQTIWQLS